MMAPQRQSVAHPAVARTEIQNAHALWVTRLDGRQKVAGEEAEGACADLPLPGILARQVTIRQLEIKGGIRRAPAFELAHLLILTGESLKPLDAVRRQCATDPVLPGENKSAPRAGQVGRGRV